MTPDRTAVILERLYGGDGQVFVAGYDGSAPDDMPEGAMLIRVEEERALVAAGLSAWSLPCSARMPGCAAGRATWEARPCP
jgi:hypothetical protein